MYCSFFGLKKLPFKISPDLTFFYKQAVRDEIVQALLFSIQRGDGIITVTGEVGVGKTTLLRLLANCLPANYLQVYLPFPTLSDKALLAFICSELSISVRAEAAKPELMAQLSRFLINEYRQNRRVVVLVDEAQAMTLDALEELRLLGNLETDEDKLLQMVLFGQPELDVTLQDSRVRPFKDRVVNHFTLQALDNDEVMHYLNYRMRVAGYMQTDLFSMKIAKRIRKETNGLPRSINLLADKLLMVAFSKGDARLKLSHFKGLGSSKPFVEKRQAWWLTAGLVTVVLVGFWGFLNHSNSDSVEVETDSLRLWQLSEQLTDVAADLGVSSQSLAQLTDLDRKARQFLNAQSASKPLILLKELPLRDFEDVYSRVLNGLGATNRTYLFALLDARDSEDIRFRLLYDPRATTGAILQNKQTDLQTLSGEESHIIPVSRVNEMVKRSFDELTVSAGS